MLLVVGLNPRRKRCPAGSMEGAWRTGPRSQVRAGTGLRERLRSPSWIPSKNSVTALPRLRAVTWRCPRSTSSSWMRPSCSRPLSRS